MKCRTTVTLDEELLQWVREESVATRRRFGEVLNDRLRRGYSVNKGTKRFIVRPLKMGGFAPGVDQDKLNQLFDTLESEKD